MAPIHKKEILKKIDLLSFFHDSTLERLAQESKEIQLGEGQIVFSEGDPGNTMYIVLKGEILIQQNGKTLTHMRPGTFFGEMSLIESRARNAVARAMVPSLLMEIDEYQFRDYFAVQPQALMAIMKTLSARSRKISSSLTKNHFNHSEFDGTGLETTFEPIPSSQPRETFVFRRDDFTIVRVNPSSCQEIGLSPEEVQGTNFLDLAAHLNAESLQQHLAPLYQKLRTSISFETLLRWKNEVTFPVECRFEIQNSDSETGEIAVWVQDITERKQMEEAIRQMAYYDSLTGLPNRNLLNDRLAIALANATRSKELVALLFLDLDHFKKINDSLGHGAGDQLLQEVARRLGALFRKQDTVARMGGDEFIVLLPGIKKSEVVAPLAEKILHAMAPPFQVGGQEIYVSCSIGISIFPHDGLEIKSLLKNADLAMYRAKDQGRNSFQLFTASMNSRAMERLAVERNLRNAHERNEFELYYQPKINLHTGAISGMEALIRWNSPELGMVMPNLFIPIAEETRLIIPLGSWIMATACQQAKLWREQGHEPGPIAVNLSIIQFAHPNLVTDIRNLLSESGVTADMLEIEITESVLMQDTQMVVSKLKELSELGIKIAIDDFGTGFSSLNYLKNLPIDYLKIDRTFVKDHDIHTNAAITQTIIALAQSLKLKTIAEGVETPEQMRFLKSLGCDEAQGYLFSKPMPSENFPEFSQSFDFNNFKPEIS